MVEKTWDTYCWDFQLMGFSIGIDTSSFYESSVFDKLDIALSLEKERAFECHSVSDFSGVASPCNHDNIDSWIQQTSLLKDQETFSVDG